MQARSEGPAQLTPSKPILRPFSFGRESRAGSAFSARPRPPAGGLSPPGWTASNNDRIDRFVFLLKEEKKQVLQPEARRAEKAEPARLSRPNEKGRTNTIQTSAMRQTELALGEFAASAEGASVAGARAVGPS